MRAWCTSRTTLILFFPYLSSTCMSAVHDHGGAPGVGLRQSGEPFAFCSLQLLSKTTPLQGNPSCPSDPRPYRKGFFEIKSSASRKAALVSASLSRSSKNEDTTGKLPKGLIERRVKIADIELNVVEFDQTTDILDDWIENQMTKVDPFGVVLWPAAKVLAESLFAEDLDGKTVLELGAGTGLCSLAAALKGAAVTATDTNPATLELLEIAAERQGLTGVTTGLLDITVPAEQVPLDFDVLVGADCLYNKQIAKGLARIADRAHQLGVRVMIADSVNIARDEFEGEVVFPAPNHRLTEGGWKAGAARGWLTRLGQEHSVQFEPLCFTGSAVGADMDVTRNVTVAVYHLLGREAGQA